MPLSTSRNQVDKLGKRLRDADEPSRSDLDALAQLRQDHAPAVVDVSRLLSAQLGLSSTWRLKTNRTIIEKLRRPPFMALSRMQDIAGLRVVADWTLSEQTAAGQAIQELFPGGRWDDRRSRPSYGYRALHVISSVDGCSVEVQLRTVQQHQWAELFEKLADLWGRRIRYGEPPIAAESAVGAIGFSTRQSIVDMLQTMSNIVARAEESLDRAASVPIWVADALPLSDQRRGRFTSHHQAALRDVETLTQALKALRDAFGTTIR